MAHRLAVAIRSTLAAGSGDAMYWIDDGPFQMGAEGAYPEEAPVRSVTISGFWTGEDAVTSTKFAIFVGITGYRTVAERPIDQAAYFYTPTTASAIARPLVARRASTPPPAISAFVA